MQENSCKSTDDPCMICIFCEKGGLHNAYTRGGQPFEAHVPKSGKSAMQNFLTCQPKFLGNIKNYLMLIYLFIN